MNLAATLLLALSTLQHAAPVPDTRSFAVDRPGEVVASITAGCARCDWQQPGREAVLLQLAVDGTYSQHLPLVRGEEPQTYRVMLGHLDAGRHTLTITRDVQRSAPDAGAATIHAIAFTTYAESSPEYDWLRRAPFLRARPGTVDHFSDFPLLMYAERDVRGETGQHYRYQYTVIFTNEDGGTPTDRLMATWGRTTDIEFVFGVTASAEGGTPGEEIQAEGHRWVPFQGPRRADHPVLWVSTLNNMVADHGPEDAITFAPAPAMVDLAGTSREAVMDTNPWTYAITSAEMAREGRVDPDATAGSGKIPDPRRYATVEACGDVKDATLAFDIGVRGSDGTTTWFATDRGDPKFRIARGGCFRGGAPLPSGTTPSQIAALRIRAYTRPAREDEAPLPAGSGSVTLRSVNRVFMLDEHFVPVKSPFVWSGTLDVKTDRAPVAVGR
jgi:hypothetical protein